jgi:hypothetical protein
MTRKDYIRFAAMLKDARINLLSEDYFQPGYKHTWNKSINLVISRTADIFAADNARFDRAKFLKACGVEA